MEQSKIIPIVIDVSHLRSLIISDKTLLGHHLKQKLGLSINHFVLLQNRGRYYLHMLMRGKPSEKLEMIQNAYNHLTDISEDISKMLIDEMFNKKRIIRTCGEDIDPYKGLDITVSRLIISKGVMNLWNIINTVLYNLSDKDITQSYVIQICLTTIENMVIEKDAIIQYENICMNDKNISTLTNGEPLQLKYFITDNTTDVISTMNEIIVETTSHKRFRS